MIQLLPAWCFHCHRFISRPLLSPSPYLCRSCYEMLPVIDRPICRRCGLHHPTGDCREPWAEHIHTFYAMFYYQDPIQRWIVNLKYSGGFFAGRLLRHFIDVWFETNAERVRNLDAVLPVPIHPFRLRQRGFNQTTFLLRKQRILPLQTRILKKQRFTSQQAGLARWKRSDNIRDSFQAHASVHSKNVLVFDDVCTTGQTLGEVCTCLKKAGAGEIHVLTLSRSM
ncbi:hypothetical protein KKI24_09765 [bacterium]|nr:hypothetical protein [bacterium]